MSARRGPPLSAASPRPHWARWRCPRGRQHGAMPQAQPRAIDAAIAACRQAHIAVRRWLIFEVRGSMPVPVMLGKGSLVVNRRCAVAWSSRSTLALVAPNAKSCVAERTTSRSVVRGGRHARRAEKGQHRNEGQARELGPHGRVHARQKTAREPWFAERRSRASKMAAVLRDLTTDKRPEPAALVAIGFPKKDD